MESPKCPRCDGPTEKELYGDGFICLDNDCHISFTLCPFCQQLLALYKDGSSDHRGCHHVVVEYPDPPGEWFWSIRSEKEAFEAWRKKRVWLVDLREAFDEFAKERSYTVVYLPDDEGHFMISQTFYLLEHPPKK